MINIAAVFTDGGAVLWSTSYAICDLLIIKEFIQNILIENRFSKDSIYQHGLYSLKWVKDQQSKLIFIVDCLSTTPSELLDELLSEFHKSFALLLKGTTIGTTLSAQKSFGKYSTYFSKLEKRFMAKVATFKRNKRTPKTKVAFGSNTKRGDQDSKTEDTNSKDGKLKTESDGLKKELKKSMPSKKPKAGKEKRVWSDKKLSKSEKLALDFSASKGEQNLLKDGASDFSSNANKIHLNEAILVSSDDEEIASNHEKESSASLSSRLQSFFDVMSSKKLDEKELRSALKASEELLIDKNVTMEISREICESVRRELLGSTVNRFSFTSSLVKKAFQDALRRIITPSKPVHILRDISRARDNRVPYSILFIGVNGVGKSTTLAKIAYYLQKRNLRVSIAACDTFRSGAVEQLLTHAKALSLRVFHKGYARDASKVCAEALREAETKHDDVVLIDTAGRMQNNEPLMRSLEKLCNKNKPNLVLFVGEALVGNEALDQLTTFRQYAPIDGIILTKFDTVEDKVGAAISMTYCSRLPIVFVGSGQTYKDLSRVSPEGLVKKLLK